MEFSTRAALRGQITKIVKTATEYLKDDSSQLLDDNSPKFNEIEEEVVSLIQRLTALNDGLNTVNEDLRQKELLTANDPVEKIIEYQDQVVGTLARLNTRLVKLRQKQNPTPNAVEPGSISISSSSHSNGAKLPKLPLKRFDGSFDQWLPFWEQFQCAVHENPNLSPSEKFNYLESVLAGDAKKTIAGFTPSEKCYEAAISLLQEQFGNSEKLIDKHIQLLINLSVVHNRADVSGLRILYGKVVACTRSLTALQVPSSHYCVMLRSILLRCLPTDLRTDYHRQMEQALPDATEAASNRGESSLSIINSDEVKDILRFLKREIESLERSGVTHTNAKPRTPVTSTASSLIAFSDDTSCVFCKSKSHATKDCDSKISLTEKRNTLRTTGRCFRCAKRGHSSKKCRSGKFLSCKKCHGRHMTTMCDPNFKSSPPVSQRKNEENVEMSNMTRDSTLNLCAHNTKPNIFLKTVRCTARERNQLLSIRAIIDGGSHYTYIRESVVQKLKLKRLGEIKLSVIPFGNKKANPTETFAKVAVNLRNEMGNGHTVSLVAVVVPEICLDVLEVPQKDCALFRSIKLADVRPEGVESMDGLSLLIGSDFYWTVVTGKQRRLTNQLRAIETVFGWTLQGLHNFVSENKQALNDNFCIRSSNLLNLAYPHDFWSLETIGIKNDADENIALTNTLIERCITKKGSRYVAKLPWKDSNSVLCSNKAQASRRFEALYRRLARDPNKLMDYDAAIQKLIKEGIAELVHEPEEPSNQRIFYLPHRPVYKEANISTKLRVVFDASAHEEGMHSLNDLLWTGANLLPDVLMVLLNFRLGPYGIVADIEKAFLQIVLHEEDRDTHRFFWFANELRSPSDTLERAEFRMTRLTFGVNSSPFLLCATIRHHLANEKHQFADTCAALQNIYMDDLATSVNTEAEALRTCVEATSIFKRASMNLHKWNSNSSVVRRRMNSCETPPVQKVLGLSWFQHTDELSVPMNTIETMLSSSMTRGTKRNVLQAIARIYDPLGILGPTIVKLKILFQILWKKNYLWDQMLVGDLLIQWEDCMKSIIELKSVTFPRAVLTCHPDQTAIQIHIFADASIKAYGTVAFFKSVSLSGQVQVEFLCAKNRIAPIKEDGDSELTLPKLELTAALIASRLHSYLKRSLKLAHVEYYLWTDSKITLSWIQGDWQKWKPYVQNRVEEIRKLTRVSQWHHCKGKENPADLLTRGVSGTVLRKSTLWAHGPQWLQNCDDVWKEDGQDESTITSTLLLADLALSAATEKHPPIIAYRDYSSWGRLLRVTAFVQRFVQHLREKKRSCSDRECSVVPLSASETQAAENYWLRYVQKDNFAHEVSLLQRGKVIKSSKIEKLAPFLDHDGILRLGGRLQALEESLDAKHPVILPANSHLVNLIIDDYHRRFLHAGVNVVLTELRRRMWIIKGRQTIKKRIKGCVICKKLWSQPASQPFAPLPKERIALSRPFDNVGVDFAGPLYCYSDKREAAKVYIAIFTCAAIRAVHLELVTSLSTENFLMALRRFISRRGVPSSIMSDNAKTFRRAAIELRSSECSWDEEVLQGFMSQRKIQWRFIVERAPWWGGFWERMIRTMKNILKVTIGKAKLNFDQLRTLLTEAEDIVNRRPLTYVSADPLDLSPLTPSSFLIGPQTMNLTACTEHLEAGLLRDVWKQRMKFSNKLKRRWCLEYLQLLRSFHLHPNGPSVQLNAGDVVLVSDPSISRINWKMAIVEQAFIGRDQKVRSCQIRLADGKQLRRPIQLLYPLEISSRPAEDVKK